MLEPRRLTTLRVSTVCYMDSFTDSHCFHSIKSQLASLVSILSIIWYFIRQGCVMERVGMALRKRTGLCALALWRLQCDEESTRMCAFLWDWWANQTQVHIGYNICHRYEWGLTSLWLLKNNKLRDWKKCIYSPYLPLSSTHLWLRCSKFSNPSKTNYFCCAANRKMGIRKSQKLISTLTYL
jgi:hypothetical protein